MKKTFITNIGDLTDIQHVSYYSFLLKGLEKELQYLLNSKHSFDSEILNKNFFYKFYFFPKNIKFVFPEKKFLEYKKGDETYSISVYLPIFYSCKDINEINNYTNLETNTKIVKQINFKNNKISNAKIKTIYCCGDIYLCEIPLMTQEGTFLITGCERVVISQIIRSPGVYFRREINSLNSSLACTATVISDKGLWTKLSLINTEKNKLHFLINSTEAEYNNILSQKKISVFSLLYFFHLSLNDILFCFSKTQQQLLLSKFDIETPSLKYKDIIENLFYNSRKGCFSIGELGRIQINQNFKQNIPTSIHYLCAHDFIFILKHIIDLKFFGRADDDIDHLKNKQIRPVGAVLQNLFRIGYLNAQSNIFTASKYKKIFSIYNKQLGATLDNLYYKHNEKIWEELLAFFKLSEISQYMDQTNVLSEMSHKRKLSFFGPNGLTRDNISNTIRDIHPSQYAKFCPIETPEGETAGLVNSVSLFARYNQLGFLETPCFQIKEGLIPFSQSAIYLNANVESLANVAFNDIALHKKSSQILQSSLNIKENTFFSVLHKRKANFITLSPVQLLSLATNLVPFIEHDDANRGLMGANMQRQSVPLLYSQKPLVGTGFESSIIIGSQMVLTTFTEGFVLTANNYSIYIKDKLNQKLKYSLKKHLCSNQDTYINQQSCVWPGEHVYSNQVIADGGGTLDGELSLGKNLTIAYMPWDGYNFEDAIIINEKLLVNKTLTSVSIQEFETNLSEDFFESLKITNSLKTKILIDYFLKLNTLSIFFITILLKYFISNNNTPFFSKQLLKDILLYLEENESMLIKNSLKSFVTKHIRYADKLYRRKKFKIVLKIPKFLKPKKKDNFLIENVYLAQFHLSKYENRNLNSYGIAKKGSYVFPHDVLVAKVKFQSEQPIGESKLLKALSRSLNPHDIFDVSYRVPDYAQGRIIDIKFLAESIPLAEFPIPNTVKHFNNISINSFKNEKIKFFLADIRSIEIGDKLAGRHGNKGVISKIVSSQDMPFLPDGTPIDIIFNPLGVPSRMNVGQIFESLLGFAGFYLNKRFKITPFDEMFGEDSSRILISQKLKEARLKSKKNWVYSSIFPGKILLKDGRTGETFDNPIFVGKSYILKLIHLVEDKLHARSIGPYTLVTEQPLAGKALEGGQRFGEMETWALEGFGCSTILNELFTIKADDIDARNFFYQSKCTKKLTRFSDSLIGETFLTLTRELNALGLNFAPKKIKIHDFKLLNLNFFKIIEKKLELNALIDKAKVKNYKKKNLMLKKNI